MKNGENDQNKTQADATTKSAKPNTNYVVCERSAKLKQYVVGRQKWPTRCLAVAVGILCCHKVEINIEKKIVIPKHRSGHVKLLKSKRYGDLSAGVMVQHISVTLWSHLEHAESISMPPDFASAMA